MKKDRLNQLIKTLIVKNQFVTTRELSSELGIAEKTIYRMVRELNEIYFPEVLIVSEKGKGYCLNEHLKNGSINFIYNEYMSAEKRRENILEKLLMISPNSISTIFFLISIDTISVSVLLSCLFAIPKSEVCISFPKIS